MISNQDNVVSGAFAPDEETGPAAPKRPSALTHS